ncbi:MAG: DUF5661 family protein [Candidatus Paceibacterota bacterium]|jgi:hypothetical protein|nr:hypothetical protein [bacterium]
MEEIFTKEEIKQTGEQLGVDWSHFDVDQLWRGAHIELEHGTRDAITNVTNNDKVMTVKIALAHLNEFPDYYDRLEKLEKEAEDFWKK